ncbi:TPA: hypothetical protein ACGZ6C_003823 [Klebsiella oxytoca]|nr:hypothetical protein [Klebsiella oxytoca]
MTPRQRRQHQKAVEQAAMAPNKRWLGRSVLLTSVQSAWIKSLLTVWGECMGGKTRAEYRLQNRDQFWGKLREEGWCDGQLSRITEALKQARNEGFRGKQAMQRARSILWPVKLSDMIKEAENKDDAEFIELALLKTFNTDDPVYVIGMNYYTTRKKIAELARELQHVAPWLTPEMARERVKWCLQIFQAKAFLVVRESLRG